MKLLFSIGVSTSEGVLEKEGEAGVAEGHVLAFRHQALHTVACAIINRPSGGRIFLLERFRTLQKNALRNFLKSHVCLLVDTKLCAQSQRFQSDCPSGGRSNPPRGSKSKPQGYLTTSHHHLALSQSIWAHQCVSPGPFPIQS